MSRSGDLVNRRYVASAAGFREGVPKGGEKWDLLRVLKYSCGYAQRREPGAEGVVNQR